MPNAESEPLRKTPLHDLHIELGAKMVPFAGYEMPVQYPAGILAEHRQTREMAGLFDVSHMGQVKLSGDDPAGALETLVPGEIQRLDLGRMRYTQLTNEVGGILDDLMVTNRQDHLFLVLNAACKEADVAHLRAHIGDRCNVAELEDRALLALQGPAAVDALVRLASKARGMSFMSGVDLSVDDIPCFVTPLGLYR